MIPHVGGTYALLLSSSSTGRLRVGRLGMLSLRPGWYIYVGSAFGPGGLWARIGHHLRIAKRPRWHIDYLRRRVQAEAAWYVPGDRREHDWAAAIGGLREARIPLEGFGSSDCNCMTHLFQFKNRPSLQALRRVLGGIVAAGIR